VAGRAKELTLRDLSPEKLLGNTPTLRDLERFRGRVDMVDLEAFSCAAPGADAAESLNGFLSAAVIASEDVWPILFRG
jgi:hypothetical protein